MGNRVENRGILHTDSKGSDLHYRDRRSPKFTKERWHHEYHDY